MITVCSMLLSNMHTPAESNNISVVLCRCRFAELGHSVVGIEASTIPIEAFSMNANSSTVLKCVNRYQATYTT